MIFKVKIYDRKGNYKTTISAKDLIKRHWETFQKAEEAPKKFIIDRMQTDMHKELQEYRELNNMIDNLHKS